MRKLKTRDLTLIGMFTALTVLLSQLSIPLPFTPVPMNLAMLSIFVGGGVLGSLKGMLSQIIYVLLGAIGLPVFANFTSGLGILVGPTGGYIAGYILAAFVIGALKGEKERSMGIYALIMGVGLLICYSLGTIWFMLVTKTGFFATLLMCVFPFLIGDFIKILLASFLVKRLEKAI